MCLPNFPGRLSLRTIVEVIFYDVLSWYTQVSPIFRSISCTSQFFHSFAAIHRHPLVMTHFDGSLEGILPFILKQLHYRKFCPVIIIFHSCFLVTGKIRFSKQSSDFWKVMFPIRNVVKLVFWEFQKWFSRICGYQSGSGWVCSYWKIKFCKPRILHRIRSNFLSASLRLICARTRLVRDTRIDKLYPAIRWFLFFLQFATICCLFCFVLFVFAIVD